MEIHAYGSASVPENDLSQLRHCDWSAGSYLYELLKKRKLEQLYGENARFLTLTEGNSLVSFCTYVKQDEIRDAELTPWVGFAYTFPGGRGKRRMGKLLEYAYLLAKQEGHPWLYISTEETGLYEKYGFTFWKTMPNDRGNVSRVYRLKIERKDYSGVIGMAVTGTVDRPLGSAHPRHPEMIYPVNYGYVNGVYAGDGAEQDVYLFGTDQPLSTFTGRVAGVYHRLNDCEDKWIVTLDGKTLGRDEILSTISFQEQFFMGELYL